MWLPLTDSMIRSDEMQMGVKKKKRNAEQNHWKQHSKKNIDIWIGSWDCSFSILALFFIIK
jgi:hypothetical protein